MWDWDSDNQLTLRNKSTGDELNKISIGEKRSTDQHVWVFKCPYCNLELEIHENEINCAIFRHGYHLNGQQIQPHASKSECDNLVKSKSITGCAGAITFILGMIIKTNHST